RPMQVLRHALCVSTSEGCVREKNLNCPPNSSRRRCQQCKWPVGEEALGRWRRRGCGVCAGARPRPSSLYLAWWAIVFLQTAPTIAVAETFAVRLRWQPSADPSVSGYRAYVRRLDPSYGPPQDLGLPALEIDGTLSSILGGLDAASGYAFALTAYLADGTESGLSNELEVPALSTPPSCTSDADCINGAVAAPCRAAFCSAATCAPPGGPATAPPDHSPRVDRFVFRLGRRPRRLHAAWVLRRQQSARSDDDWCVDRRRSGRW